MSTYAVSMDCEHATIPSVLWNVWVFDEVKGGISNPEVCGHKLWVPELDTWTLDTLRMVLHELASYLPAHDSAVATVCAKAHRAPGRPRKEQAQRPPRLAENVSISVSARGWRAEVRTDRNEIADQDGKYLGRSPGEWTAPMQAVLLDLTAKSPFPLSTVRPVNCAKGLTVPSRSDVVRGIKPSPDRKDCAAELAKIINRLARRIDAIEADLEADDE